MKKINILGALKASFKAHTGFSYFFTDKKYYRYKTSVNKLDNSGQDIKNWNGVPYNFDAAIFNPKNGKYYFFKNDLYYKYDFEKGVMGKTYKIGEEGWKKVPAHIDAAVAHPTNQDIVYFFKGNLYYRYNHKIGKVDNAYPLPISDNWKGLPDNIDAALLHANGKMYFFKCGVYYRYDFTADYVDDIGVMGIHDWKELGFTCACKNKKNIKLKVTLTRVKSVQAADSDDIEDFLINQWIDYKVNDSPIISYDKTIRFGYGKEGLPLLNENKNIIISSFRYIADELNAEFELTDRIEFLHVKEGDEHHYINNSLFFNLSDEQAANDAALFRIYTNLYENDGQTFVGALNDNQTIAEKAFINVPIHEILEYLLQPNDPKYNGNRFFNGGHNDEIHETGSFGDTMWFERDSHKALKGTLEFGDNNKETYVRFYYRFELVA